ncbi:hypothetical protein ASG54_15105 [Aureimonas sp. Leaf460]|nr:hypothetical protein ASG62_01115 [Aureimonas sp. Leaf427]KQT76299.1 hypothetical protein ASG54_15105 [Aureimonas sp. Leaf460]
MEAQAAIERCRAFVEDPVLVDEVDRLLSGRTRKIRLRGRLHELYRERTFRQSSKLVRHWMMWIVAIDILGTVLNCTFLPRDVLIAALMPGGMILACALCVVTLYRGDGTMVLKDAGLVGGTFVILCSVALVGVIAGPEYYERYTSIMIFVALTAIVIFSIPTAWTWTIAASAIFILTGVQFGNPVVETASAVATVLIFAAGLAGAVVASQTTAILAQKSFLLSLRDLKHVSDLAVANQRLETLARTDPLTGVANRRWMTERLDALWSGGAAMPGRVAILMCDIDHFKSLNDTLGHMEGDRCLREVANVLTDCIRPTVDHVARYGGEEFLVLLSDVDGFDAMLTAERICRTVEASLLANPGSTVSRYVTVSIGVASATPETALSADSLQRQADEALYRAKAAGRNRVVSFDGAADTARLPLLGLASAG